MLDTLFLDSEVDDGCLGWDLGRVVGVGELCRDVEPELRVVLNLLVADTDHVGSTWTSVVEVQ